MGGPEWRRAWRVLPTFALVATSIMATVLMFIDASTGVRDWAYHIEPLLGPAATFFAAIASAGVLLEMAERRRRLRRRRRQVFIAYRHEDLEFARALAHGLELRGFRTWLDVDQLQPGVEWRRAIADGIEESGAALVLFGGQRKEDAGMLGREISMLVSQMRSSDPRFSPVIPVRIGDGPIPKPLADIEAVDISHSRDLEQLDATLAAVLRGLE